MATARKKVIKEKEVVLSRTLQKRIAALGSIWRLEEKSKRLVAVFDFDRYLDGFMFATRISVHAEVMDHHPGLCITYNTVKVTLTTHDKKCVTELDVELAERINKLLSTRR